MKYLSALGRRFYAIMYCVFCKLIYYKCFHFKMMPIFSCFVKFTINDSGQIEIGENVGMKSGVQISVSERGCVVIGDKCFINRNSMIVSHDKIVVGSGTRIGPNVMIFDHDYDYKNIENFKNGKHVSAPIIIGNNCWIGAGAIILKGSKIGDNCVIGAGTVVKGSFPDDSIVIQKREDICKKIERD